MDAVGERAKAQGETVRETGVRVACDVLRSRGRPVPKGGCSWEEPHAERHARALHDPAGGQLRRGGADADGLEPADAGRGQVRRRSGACAGCCSRADGAAERVVREA